MSESERDRILNTEVIEKSARKGLKTIIYAYKDIPIDDWNFLKDQNNNFLEEHDRHVLEQNLTFLAAFGLNDELRDGVPEVIRKLYEGGTNVRMITGDSL